MTEDISSLQIQLEEIRDNLRLVRERKAQYVQETDVPLQIIKEERRLEEDQERISAEIARLGTGKSPVPSSPVVPSAASKGLRQYLKENPVIIVAFVTLISAVLVALITVLPELVQIARAKPAVAVTVALATTMSTDPTTPLIAGGSPTVSSTGTALPELSPSPTQSGVVPMVSPADTPPPVAIAVDTETHSPTPAEPETPTATQAPQAPSTSTPTLTASIPISPTATATPSATPTEVSDTETALKSILSDLNHAYEGALVDMETNWHPLLDQYYCGKEAEKSRQRVEGWLIAVFGPRIRATNPELDTRQIKPLGEGKWKVVQVETWCYESLPAQENSFVKRETHQYTYRFQPNEKPDGPVFCIFQYETVRENQAYSCSD